MAMPREGRALSLPCSRSMPHLILSPVPTPPLVLAAAGCAGGYAYIKGVVDQAKANGPTLFLDAGDQLSGSLFSIAQGAEAFPFLTQMGLDAMVRPPQAAACCLAGDLSARIPLLPSCRPLVPGAMPSAVASTWRHVLSGRKDMGSAVCLAPGRPRS